MKFIGCSYERMVYEACCIDRMNKVAVQRYTGARCRFMAGDDEAADRRRDGIFKLIPSVVKGSWVIKQSVGHTPVVLGRKLKTQYHRCVPATFDTASFGRTKRISSRDKRPLGVRPIRHTALCYALCMKRATATKEVFF